jgi:hypothetical protein
MEIVNGEVIKYEIKQLAGDKLKEDLKKWQLINK